MIASCWTLRLNRLSADSIDSLSSTTTKANTNHLLVSKQKTYNRIDLYCQGKIEDIE